MSSLLTVLKSFNFTFLNVNFPELRLNSSSSSSANSGILSIPKDFKTSSEFFSNKTTLTSPKINPCFSAGRSKKLFLNSCSTSDNAIILST